MAITKRQQELDKIKWDRSVELGYDACGSFDYCSMCDKSLENPCDRACTKMNEKQEESATEVDEIQQVCETPPQMKEGLTEELPAILPEDEDDLKEENEEAEEEEGAEEDEPRVARAVRTKARPQSKAKSKGHCKYTKKSAKAPQKKSIKVVKKSR